MGRVNPWLAEKLAQTNSPRSLTLLVDVEDPEKVDEVGAQLRAIQGVSVGAPVLGVFRVTVPLAAVDVIAAIPGVIVSYDAPVYIRTAPSRIDPLIGKISLSEVEVPFSLQEMALRIPRDFIFYGITTFPFRLLQQFFGVKTGLGSLQDPRYIIVPTGETRKWLQVPEDNKMTGTKVAVLDTGLALPHPCFHPSKGFIQLGTFAGPVPFDALGHGQWCVACAFGDSSPTRFGEVRGVADPENGTLGSWKVLSDIGFGSTYGILQGIEAAVKWGARVISMSLGGSLQGGVDDDPMCRAIADLKDTVTFVVAAGNDGPAEWTIGSPAAAPYALTVGSWSTVYNGLSIFSSRGPSSEWYKDHPEDWRRDLDKYGDKMVKPDVVDPGGGPVEEGQKTDLIYSAVVGWTDGLYDLTPFDLFGPMRGTSMATPAAAGLVALAMDRGHIGTAEDVKARMARGNNKNHRSGYGFATWPRLLP